LFNKKITFFKQKNKKFAVKIAKKDYFNIFCHIIIMICDMLEKSKLNMLLGLLKLKKFAVSIIIKKIFMINIRSIASKLYTDLH